jgi:hypothetical protein
MRMSDSAAEARASQLWNGPESRLGHVCFPCILDAARFEDG